MIVGIKIPRSSQQESRFIWGFDFFLEDQVGEFFSNFSNLFYLVFFAVILSLTY